MNPAAELSAIAAELIALDRRLNRLYQRAPLEIGDRMDAVYARCPFHPNVGAELAALAATIEREDERAIIHAKVA